MAKKSAKVNKTLEKAKKLVSKKGKSKTTKRSYPEGQNAPQSKAYNMENDKLQSAKSAGWRFTKEGAKKLNKKPTDKPTTSEIEKYRNQTFKVKGKVNKSGPSGSGDGSFRYLYVERRADKSDISKARKLELGGYNPDEMLNVKVYVDVYEDDYEQGEGKNVNSYTVDWLKDPNVLAKDLVKYLSNNLYISDNPNDYIIGDDGVIHTDQLQDSEGSGASKGQIERWKEGKEKLYNAHFTILVTAVKNRKPSVDELSQATGIGTYAKGGKTKKFLTYYEVYDENTDKTLNIQAYSFEEAEEIASTIEFDNFKDGEDIEYQEMAKGGVVFDPKEVREFQKYVFSYYGKNGTFVDVMEEGIPATTGEVLKAVSQYLAYLSSPKKSTDVTWGNGDSWDREVVRDIIKYNRNPRAIVEYPFLIKDMKKTPILEYGGILQPMIGGVNADPRFDIYNTTMFAEKGAELDKGYSKKERVIDYYLNNDIYDDPYSYDVTEDDLKDAHKKNDFSKLEKAIIKYHGLNDPSNVEERFEALGLDDEYAKGAEVPHGEKEQVKFFEIVNEINNLEYDGDPKDRRLHSESRFYWGANNEDDYDEATKQINQIGIKGKGWEIYATYDVSGYDYWMKTTREPNYIHIVVSFDKQTVHEDEIGKIESALYEAIMDAERISNAFDYDPSTSDDDDYAKGGEITMATLKKREIKKINQLIEEYAHRGDSIEFYEPFSINVNDTDYLAWAIVEDAIAVTDNEGYDGGMPLKKLTFFQLQKVTSKIMDSIGEMAKGGKTHEQGYDDREDERLAMRHGKIASKDFVGSHKRREHSRRDDARFETRNK